MVIGVRHCRDRAGWDADHRDARLDVGGHHRAGTHERARADGDARQHVGTGADRDALGQVHVAAHRRPRIHADEVVEHRVVPDRAVDVELRVAPERDVRRHPAAGGEDASLGDPVVATDGRHRMDEGERLAPGRGEPLVDRAAHPAGTDGDHVADVAVDRSTVAWSSSTSMAPSRDVPRRASSSSDAPWSST